MFEQINDSHKSKNQLLVELMTRQMSGHEPWQSIPVKPTIPSFEVRKLRAALMLEEVLETIDALGLTARSTVGGCLYELTADGVDYAEKGKPDLIKIADGLADLEVVSSCGTASACGIAMQPIFEAVACNNLLKFAPGYSYRKDGKLVKPVNHPSVSLAIVAHLTDQGWVRRFGDTP